MKIEFNNNLPIYIQIMESVKQEIVSGKLKEGDKLPSVRELALELQINPNTIQRTFQELEREELVMTQRGMGRYVTEDRNKIMKLKKEMSTEILEKFINEMKSLGFNKEDIIELISLELNGK